MSELFNFLNSSLYLNLMFLFIQQFCSAERVSGSERTREAAGAAVSSGSGGYYDIILSYLKYFNAVHFISFQSDMHFY